MLSAKTPLNVKASWVLLSVLALSLLLSACGFHLKQAHALPFNSLYINISENSALGAQLRRIILANSPNVRLVSNPEQADVRLIQTEQQRYLRELSLDPNGNVEDYELVLRLSFMLIDRAGEPLLPTTTLVINREIPNNPEAVQAKQMEIDSVFQNMEVSMVDRILRHLSSEEVSQAYQAHVDALNADNAPAASPITQ